MVLLLALGAVGRSLLKVCSCTGPSAQCPPMTLVLWRPACYPQELFGHTSILPLLVAAIAVLVYGRYARHTASAVAAVGARRAPRMAPSQRWEIEGDDSPADAAALVDSGGDELGDDGDTYSSQLAAAKSRLLGQRRYSARGPGATSDLTTFVRKRPPPPRSTGQHPVPAFGAAADPADSAAAAPPAAGPTRAVYLGRADAKRRHAAARVAAASASAASGAK